VRVSRQLVVELDRSVLASVCESHNEGDQAMSERAIEAAAAAISAAYEPAVNPKAPYAKHMARKAAEDAIAAAQRVAGEELQLPEGWHLAPDIVTGEMIDAFNNAGASYAKGGKTFATFSERYDAMRRAILALKVKG
jgi:hypothetical protein